MLVLILIEFVAANAYLFSQLRSWSLISQMEEYCLNPPMLQLLLSREIKKAPGPPPSVDLFLLVHASSVDDVISEIRSIGVGS